MIAFSDAISYPWAVTINNDMVVKCMMRDYSQT
jgi:hypothetical protein